MPDSSPPTAAHVVFAVGACSPTLFFVVVGVDAVQIHHHKKYTVLAGDARNPNSDFRESTCSCDTYPCKDVVSLI